MFLCPLFMLCWLIHILHFITKLKIHHLYLFTEIVYKSSSSEDWIKCWRHFKLNIPRPLGSYSRENHLLIINYTNVIYCKQCQGLFYSFCCVTAKQELSKWVFVIYNLDELYGNELWTWFFQVWFCLFKEHWSRNCNLVLCTQFLYVIFLVISNSPRDLKKAFTS